MLTFKCSTLTRELFLPFPVRYGMAEGSGILMIRLPFAFYLADPEPDIINVGNLSPGALLLYGRLSYWQQDHSTGNVGSIKSSSLSLSGFLCGISFSLDLLCGMGLEWDGGCLCHLCHLRFQVFLKPGCPSILSLKC